MNKIITISLLLIFSGFSAAASEPPIPQCATLNESKSYDAKYANLKYLSIGKDNTLFRSVDFKKDFVFRPDTIEYLTRMNKILRDGGTQLVVVYIPTRGMMLSSKIDPRVKEQADYPLEVATASFTNAVRSLNSSGVLAPIITQSTIDIDPSLYFSTRDHHWTPTGAEASAKVVADAIIKSPLYREITKRDFVTKEYKKIPFKGTFALAYEDLCKGPLLYNIALPRYVTAPMKDEGLLDSNSPEIILAGTSFSNWGNSDSKEIMDFNFSGFLAQYLNADVANYSVSGGWIDSAMISYFAQQYKNERPKFIVWELSSYDLNAPTLFKQLIPNIYDAQNKSNLVLPSTAKMGVDGISFVAPAEKFDYLKIIIPDKKVRKFTLSIDGVDTVIERSDRINNSGIFYYEVSSQATNVSIKSINFNEKILLEFRKYK